MTGDERLAFVQRSLQTEHLTKLIDSKSLGFGLGCDAEALQTSQRPRTAANAGGAEPPPSSTTVHAPHAGAARPGHRASLPGPGKLEEPTILNE